MNVVFEQVTDRKIRVQKVFKVSVLIHLFYLNFKKNKYIYLFVQKISVPSNFHHLPRKNS